MIPYKQVRRSPKEVNVIARRIEATNEPSPLSPVMEKFVRDEWTKLESSQITPWAFFNSGPPMRVKDFYGRDISLRIPAIVTERSART